MACLQREGIDRQMRRSNVLLGKYAAARHFRVIVRNDIAGQVCRSSVLLGMCPTAWFCWASVQIQDNAGQVC